MKCGWNINLGGGMKRAEAHFGMRKDFRWFIWLAATNFSCLPNTNQRNGSYFVWQVLWAFFRLNFKPFRMSSEPLFLATNISKSINIGLRTRNYVFYVHIGSGLTFQRVLNPDPNWLSHSSGSGPYAMYKWIVHCPQLVILWAPTKLLCYIN
jgi:hypothetical protein